MGIFIRNGIRSNSLQKLGKRTSGDNPEHSKSNNIQF